ncbi:MAG: hypothetical protein H5T99_00460 [Moorella sp. (in: Bacteria)]|nr:hypothetical protein [Moorella sp. (in: firmicutes)]
MSKKEKISLYLDSDAAKWVRAEAARRHVAPGGLVTLALSYLRLAGAVEERLDALETDARAALLALADILAKGDPAQAQAKVRQYQARAVGNKAGLEPAGGDSDVD